MTMKLSSYKRFYGGCTPPLKTQPNKRRERGSSEKLIECELTSAKLYSACIGEYFGSVCTNE